jgi:hypothetical protein
MLISVVASHGQTGADGPLIWESVYAEILPVIDGVEDSVWEKASSLPVTVRKAIGGHNPVVVTLKSLHSKDTFYVLAKWPDATKSDMRDPHIWDKNDNRYVRPSLPDDQFALEFTLTGDFSISMLSLNREYTADVWHWKAGRGNPVGWVDDKRHIISQSPKSGAVKYEMGGHGTVYIARLMDQGESSYFLLPEPEKFCGDTLNSFASRQPSGSLADVRGKAIHNGMEWTLEMSRKFTTGHDDDAVIDPGSDVKCAIAILNDELYWHHSVSGIILLRFVHGE